MDFDPNTTARCMSRPGCVCVRFDSTTGNLRHSHRRRWCCGSGWPCKTTSGCICHPRSEELSAGWMYAASTHNFEPRATGMNLLSGTTWKGAKLRIGEAKPDFRERYGSSYLYGPLQTDCFLLSHIGSNVRMRHLRTTGQPKSVVSRGGFKVSTPQTHPSSLQKMSPHGPAGILLPWAGLFTQYECGQRSPFRSRLP